jgi:hypothetical protein
MALDATELAALRDALIRARAAGTKSVEVEGRRIEYKTDAEMATAIGDLEARIARASAPRPGAILFATSKGL